MFRRAQAVLLLLVFLSAAAMPAAAVHPAAPRFPVYPNATRTTVVANGDVAVGMFEAAAAPGPIRQWYLAALPKAGWQTRNPDRESKSDGMWRIEATHAGAGWSASVMCTNLGGGAKTRLNIRVQGDGVTAAVFGAGATEDAEQFRKEAEKEEKVRREEQGLPPSPAGPSELAAAFTAYNAAYEQLIQALERFVAQPTVRNIDAAVARAKVYTQRSAALQALAADATANQQGSICAVGMITSVTLDVELGLCVWTMEQAKAQPSTMRKAARLVEELLEKVRKTLVAAKAAAKSSDEVERIDRAMEENRPHEGLPVPKAKLAELGLPAYRPRTTLTVTRFWTPRSEFWSAALTETWKALRCWNMGCPAGCGGDPFVCKAFGEVHDPPRCLGIERTPEAEKVALSDPMQVYGLAALNIEVGDPDQLKQGGQIDVSVNGHPLYTVPLPGSPKLWGNPNPWEYAEHAAQMRVAPAEVTTAIVDKMRRGIDYVYGSEVGEYFQSVSRFPIGAITEAGGGELNGYIHFLHVGAQAAAPGDDALVLAPAAGVDWISLVKKLTNIARANHPALERKSVIRFQATVGGVASPPVEVEVPGPFQKLARQAGEWDGWPGDDEANWKFGAELGPEPQPDSPAKLDVHGDQAHKLLEDTRRFVAMCMAAIFKPWLQMAMDWGADAYLDKAAGENNLAKTQQRLAAVFQNSQGGLMITGSFGRVKKWITGTGAQLFAKNLLDQTLRDTFKQLSGASIDIAVGQRYFTDAKELADKVAVHGDPTYRCLKVDAQYKITNLRAEMWEYALLAQTHMEGEDAVTGAVDKGVWAVKTWVPASTVLADMGLLTYKSVIRGLFGATHLHYIARIVQDYYKIKEIVEDPSNWRQASG